jgi:hypothetical protein
VPFIDPVYAIFRDALFEFNDYFIRDPPWSPGGTEPNRTDSQTGKADFGQAQEQKSH